MKTILDEFGRGSIARLPKHKNPGIEIHYLKEGYLMWQCDGRIEPVLPDSIYFTMPWQEHGSIWEFEPGHYWYFIVIRTLMINGSLKLPQELGFSDIENNQIIKLLTGFQGNCLGSTELIRTLMPLLIAELESPCDFHSAKVERMCAQIVLELAQMVQKPHSLQNNFTNLKFSKLIKTLHQHSQEPWSLEQMAKFLNLRPSRFIEVFRRFTGDSPKQYLLRLRIEKARKQLRDTEDKITDIALENGFSSSQHFAKVFEKFTGVNARTYRSSGAPEIVVPRFHL